MTSTKVVSIPGELLNPNKYSTATGVKFWVIQLVVLFLGWFYFQCHLKAESHCALPLLKICRLLPPSRRQTTATGHDFSLC